MGNTIFDDTISRASSTILAYFFKKFTFEKKLSLKYSIGVEKRLLVGEGMIIYDIGRIQYSLKN